MGKTTITATPGTPFIDMERSFDAPAAYLLRAFTDPTLVVQWLGPRRLEMVIDRWDARDGGGWRYVHRDADGTEYGFRGVFHGEPSVDGLVQTFEFEGIPAMSRSTRSGSRSVTAGRSSTAIRCSSPSPTAMA